MDIWDTVEWRTTYNVWQDLRGKGKGNLKDARTLLPLLAPVKFLSPASPI
jgi:hypothetical protein